MLYKLITNIIRNHIKDRLYACLSKKKFGFVSNHRILDAIGVAQEGIHDIMVKKILSMVMKLNLAKAYDKLSWTFLRLVLLEIGLSLEVTN